ncbi:MAG: GNAT family N-acetyltransferase [Micavibrio aeruginosavorus]|uniref:GNAT family N-acetyltransferase n=1 Tax=Micavibrio aeruginosavorus TaxID=349221 RepID=A0A7T5UIF0_9BACT|nr:MAG: GNAT family N-acetyltransferase [Micavibrio aeruginosavorus]
MISYLTYNNLHEYGPAFPSLFRLRYRSFKERQGYAVSSYNGMEYDQYDTPATIYLVYRDEVSGEALGLSRLTPVSQCCMIKDLWPELVNDQSIFTDHDVWESTRFCVERSLPAHVRRIISNELVAAHVELGMRLGIKNIIGVMPTFILRSVFGKAGCSFEYLGGGIEVDNMLIRAAVMEITPRQLLRIRQTSQIKESVLLLNGGEYEDSKRAA